MGVGKLRPKPNLNIRYGRSSSSGRTRHASSKVPLDVMGSGQSTFERLKAEYAKFSAIESQPMYSKENALKQVSRKKKLVDEKALDGDDKDDDVLSSEEEDEGEGEGKQREHKGETRNHSIEPQRRCHYLEIPIGTSGNLSRRLFEVRERKVEACPQSEQVVPGKPYVCYATSDMIVVRWEVSSWNDAKRVTQYELQWCQPRLGKGKYLEAWSIDVKKEEEAMESSAGQDQDSNGVDEKTARALLGNQAVEAEIIKKEDPLLERVELFCDNEFCTITNAVVKLTDLRAEVTIRGLMGTMKNHFFPLLFRVRAKIGYLGWGEWSDVSEKITPLDRVCEALRPKMSRITCHSIRFTWEPPPEELFGKVIQYKVSGAKLNRNTVIGSALQKSKFADLERKLNSSRGSVELDWVDLYQGPSNEICVGLEPQGVPGAAGIDHARMLLEAALSEDNANFEALGIEEGLLPGDWPFVFRVVAETGTWFKGVHHTNHVASPCSMVWTLPPTLDKLPAPTIPVHHGTISSSEIHLRLPAAKTYGGGYTFSTIRIMYPFENASSWFGVDVDCGVEQQQASDDINIDCWRNQLDAHEKLKQARATNMRMDGWSEMKDEGGNKYWSNSLTGEVTWETPDYDMLVVKEYIVRGRCVDSVSNAQVLYQGPLRFVQLSGLKPESTYEFTVSAIGNRAGHGESEPSELCSVCTAPPSTGRLQLPVGWQEAWDPTTELVYYFEKKTSKIQWQHPSGTRLDDPDLVFRKKRFKLLHNLFSILPPAQNIETLRLYINRDSILEDSLQQVDHLPVDDLSRRLNVNFIGEDGIDSGGITTEWYLELSKEFFQKAMVKAGDCHHYGFPAVSEKSVYSFFGRIMAKAIYDKRLLHAPFCSYIYKFLLNVPPNMHDMQQVDPVFHQSLSWILENDITGVIFESFTIVDAQGVEHELQPGGADIEVTQENKLQYVDLVVSWKLTTAPKACLLALAQGFATVFPLELLAPFSVAELELIINGSSEVPVRELRLAAKYANGYSDRSKPVEFFWRVFREATPERKAEILGFVTGSTKVPLDNITLEIVKSDEDPETLPTSHTCFNQLVLPVFPTEQQLSEKLFLAIDNAEGFHMT